MLWRELGYPCQETVGIAIGEVRLLHRDRGTLGIGDFWIGRKRGVFAGTRQFDRLLHVDTPGMIEIEFGKPGRQQVGIRQTGELIRRRQPRDRQCGIDSVTQGLRGKVRCTGVAALLADVDADAHALVTVVLDGLDLAAANRDALAEALAGFGFGGSGTALARVVKHVAGNLSKGIG